MNQHDHGYPGPISIQQFLMLEGVARRLARKYPPDWLERRWRTLYAVTLALTFLLALVLALAWAPWWSVLVPLFTPTLVLVAVPRLLFRRTPGHPRWAHPLAALDRHDAELVRCLIGAAQAESDAPLDGERFFFIWRRARRLVVQHRG